VGREVPPGAKAVVVVPWLSRLGNRHLSLHPARVVTRLVATDEKGSGLVE
jgi:hypothetical protein